VKILRQIRRSILHQKPVPWEVLTNERLREYTEKAFDRKNVSNKPRQILLEFAAFHDAIGLANNLAAAHYEPARNIFRNQPAICKKIIAPYEGRYFHGILRDVDSYGANFRNPMNHTPLMLAARAGNPALIEVLLERGADPERADNFGMTAMHVAITRAMLDKEFARGVFPAIYSKVALRSTSVQAEGRLIKIDSHIAEFMLFHAMLCILRLQVHNPLTNSYFQGVATKDYLDGLGHFPDSVLSERRKVRQYLSGVLARNEVGRDYAYNRKIFLRMAQGHYVLNPQLSIRVGDSWAGIYDVFNLEFARNHPHPYSVHFLERLSLAVESSSLGPDPDIA
jgi:hypothetical protein